MGLQVVQALLEPTPVVCGVTVRPVGQTRSKTATAFPGKTAISTPATIMKTESAVIPGVEVLGSVPLVGGSA